MMKIDTNSATPPKPKQDVADDVDLVRELRCGLVEHGGVVDDLGGGHRGGDGSLDVGDIGAVGDLRPRWC